ncbi:MAG: DUF4160 domain-containing protein [Snowella sp.]|nr:DUF4160 domain-containing protein [Snowella sp.]
MPIISRFLGITISMYWNDHLPPHYHAKYGEYEIIVEIETGIVNGKFPKRALRHVLEWHDLHQAELLTNWQLCRQQEEPKLILPLE